MNESSPTPNQDEIRNWISEAIDGTISSSDLRRLQEALRSDRTSMQSFVDHLLLDSMLTESHQDQSVADLVDWVSDRSRLSGADAEVKTTGIAQPSADFVPDAHRGIPSSWFSLATVAALIGLVVWAVTTPDNARIPDGNTIHSELVESVSNTVDPSVAILLQSSDAIWEGMVASNARLNPGPLSLQSGLAKLQFYNGATVFLEGPVEMELLDVDHARLIRGSVRAKVPPQAQGFVIDTQKIRVVDRGTEFGLSVDETGESDVYVFDGLVELHAPQPDGVSADDLSANGESVDGGQPIREVTEGESVHVNDALESVDAELGATKFPSPEALRDRVANQLRDWQAWKQTIRSDPSIVLYFDFENVDELEATVDNQASQSDIHATRVGCDAVSGRWPQTKALGFFRPSDRLRVKVPGRFPEATLACWVRLEQIRPVNQALLLTDTFEDWQPHWQISRLGTINFGLGHQDKSIRRQIRSLSEPFVDRDLLGQWFHVATTYNSHEQRVRHYVNGQLNSRHELPFAEPLRFGTAELGNWLKPRETGDEPIRNLSGRIDEFMLFRRELSADEIATMTTIGR
ncbi:LamG-like jellyroll fold domain-containing protein [Rhodopirellula halodulae]|uniref:LamG-like jellyroll fold domain-containing protein n=1 Tax=Rhodopirellula halodulae TaxID=2894198 RepID=UPI001E4991E1|nr:LamG-like jellyroll fold domain-containing protein [Rhodopirellula sp. JC737]MCC9655942.1 FecR domain-containing protein [Rhodopirellula sp. JC737]